MQKPEWGEGKTQCVYLIALFYIHIHVRPLPGWCVVKKREAPTIPTLSFFLLTVIALVGELRERKWRWKEITKFLY